MSDFYTKIKAPATDTLTINLKQNIACARKEEKRIGSLPGAFTTNENIFLYQGHGSTITNEEGNLVIKEVPKNCIYITQTVCGIGNYGGDILRKFMTKENEEIWQNPVKHIKELKAMFGDLPNLHIHYPGCSYVDMNYLPFSYSETYDHKLIGISGLIPLSKAQTIDPSDDAIRYDQIPKTYYTISKSKLINYFNYCVYPKLELDRNIFSEKDNQTIYIKPDVNGFVKIVTIQNETDRVAAHTPVSKLMELYPGIHFNFTCRNVDFPEAKEKKNILQAEITKRRRNSAIVQGTIYNTIFRGIRQGFTEQWNEDRELLSFLLAVEGELREDADISSLSALTYSLGSRKEQFPDTFQFLKGLFEELSLTKYNELLREGDTTKIKAFLDIFDPAAEYQSEDEEHYEVSLLREMLGMALEANRPSIVRYLCKKGVDTSDMLDTYYRIKQTANRETRRRAMFSVMSCMKARKHINNQRAGKQRGKTFKKKRA